MPRNGSGTYSLPEPAFVAATVISSAAVNSDFSDIGIAITGSLPRDGQAGMTGQFKATDGSTVAPSISFINEINSGFFHAGTNLIGIVINGTQVGTIGTTGVLGTLPVGFIGDYGGNSLPAQWLLCYGQAVSRATYAALFLAIGTVYGSGDGSTTFNVPDLRGCVTAGNDAMGGVAASRLTTAFFGSDPAVSGNRGGAQNKTLITANLPPHTHNGGGTTGADSPTHTHAEQPFMTSSGVTAAASGGPAFLGGTSAGLSTGGASNSHFHSYGFTTDGGTGSSTALGVIQPALIVNKIIFAGV